MHTSARKVYHVHMTSVDDFDVALAARNVDATASTVLRHVLDTLDSLRHAPLTAASVDYLKKHGGEGVAEALEVPIDAVRTQDVEAAARRAAELLATTVSVQEAADRLNLDRSTISRRIGRRRLWAIDLGGQKRIPTWQFTEHDTIPGLDRIVAAIPPGYAPQTIAARMTTPREELDSRTIVEYLIDGGDPTLAAEAVEALGQW
ncbi:helix-turn-helix domain-containing protein [Gordonia rhizosphera]|uniref:Helix-turn-helix domain-containing protein n=1 Tax=Gordonia rhizosphera NBRC 16068 TaxID=1108045 RepID=K6V1J6_9ACTN|nr:helix-turn-helix domain-containing protein [Gordonia rhizosphera]GAB89783.1 hypothetical protein GORHZ_070_00380 [Gordonia rhizosphera NBRC 16068]